MRWSACVIVGSFHHSGSRFYCFFAVLCYFGGVRGLRKECLVVMCLVVYVRAEEVGGGGARLGFSGVIDRQTTVGGF